MNNPMQMINNFINFKNNFTGDPKSEVERMLRSGKITQAQLNQVQQQAQAFQQILNTLAK